MPTIIFNYIATKPLTKIQSKFDEQTISRHLQFLFKTHSITLDKYLAFRDANIPFPKFEERISDLEKFESFIIFKNSSKVFETFIKKHGIAPETYSKTYYADLEKANHNYEEIKDKLVEDSSIKLATNRVLNKLKISNDSIRKKIYHIMVKLRERESMMKTYHRFTEEDLSSDIIVNDLLDKLDGVLGNKKTDYLINNFNANLLPVRYHLIYESYNYLNHYGLNPNIED